MEWPGFCVAFPVTEKVTPIMKGVKIMSKILDVEWQSWHELSVNVDEIVDDCKYRMEKWHVPLEEVVDIAIEGYVSGFDDALYYSWNEDAQKQVRDAVLQAFGGVQLSMFD
jgi:hypothetical protein